MDASTARALIEDDALVIRVPIASIPQVVEGAWMLGSLDQRWKVTDPVTFARELALELNRENEQGTTRIDQMFDSAIKEALEQGADGIDEHENQSG